MRSGGGAKFGCCWWGVGDGKMYGGTGEGLKTLSCATCFILEGFEGKGIERREVIDVGGGLLLPLGGFFTVVAGTMDSRRLLTTPGLVWGFKSSVIECAGGGGSCLADVKNIPLLGARLLVDANTSEVPSKDAIDKDKLSSIM